MKMKISVTLEVIPKTGSPEELTKFLNMLAQFNTTADPEVNVQLTPEIEPVIETSEPPPWDKPTHVAAQETAIDTKKLASKLREAKVLVGSETLATIFKKNNWKLKIGLNPIETHEAIQRALQELIDAAQDAEIQTEAKPQPPSKPVASPDGDNEDDWNF